jgi:2-oxoglutarate ferredoxin oxidoreductase subunit gamma
MRKELRIVGYGGQGVVTLSMLIVTTATLQLNKYATQTDAYGPQSRGGDVWAEVVIDDEEPIDYPKVIMPDYLIALSQSAATVFGRDIKPNGIIIIDPTTVKKPPVKKDAKLYEVPVQKVAMDEFNAPVVANVILLAAFLRISGLLPLDAARNVVKTSVPPKAVEMNMRAFDRGIKLAEEVLGLGSTPGG